MKLAIKLSLNQSFNYILYKDGDKAVAFYIRINEEELKPLIMF